MALQSWTPSSYPQLLPQEAQIFIVLCPQKEVASTNGVTRGVGRQARINSLSLSTQDTESEGRTVWVAHHKMHQRAKETGMCPRSQGAQGTGRAEGREASPCLEFSHRDGGTGDWGRVGQAPECCGDCSCTYCDLGRGNSRLL